MLTGAERTGDILQRRTLGVWVSFTGHTKEWLVRADDVKSTKTGQAHNTAGSAACTRADGGLPAGVPVRRIPQCRQNGVNECVRQYAHAENARP